MAKVTVYQASELTGCSKNALHRAMQTGKLSYEIDEHGKKMIDMSELDRVYGVKKQLDIVATDQNKDQSDAAAAAAALAAQYELQRATDMLEMERLKMRLKSAEDQLHNANVQIDDLRVQRDQWLKQAQQVLLTSQHAQQQADSLKEEMKERERRDHENRQQQIALRMKRLEAQNQNNRDKSQAAAQPESLWQRLISKVSG